MPNARKCKHCGEYGKDHITINMSSFCGHQCAVKYSLKQSAKKREKEAQKLRKAFKAETRLKKKALDINDTRKQHALTQPVFNRLQVLREFKWFADRGLEPYCICCLKPLGGDQWCNGHYKSVGANSALRYDPLNSYLTHNRSCNMGKSGDIEGLKKGLIFRFGEEKGNEIIDYCETHERVRRYAGQELHSMRAEFNKEIRELEKELGERA